jgi:hypothetical protein
VDRKLLMSTGPRIAEGAVQSVCDESVEVGDVNIEPTHLPIALSCLHDDALRHVHLCLRCLNRRRRGVLC